MERRDILLAGTAGIAALAGCSGDSEEKSAIVETVNSGTEEFEQGRDLLRDCRGLINEERWGSAEGSARDAAEKYTNAENDFRKGKNQAEELENAELAEMIEVYRKAADIGISASTSAEQGCSAMVEGDRSSAQSHFERYDQYQAEYEGLDKPDRSELQDALES